MKPSKLKFVKEFLHNMGYRPEENADANHLILNINSSLQSKVILPNDNKKSQKNGVIDYPSMLGHRIDSKTSSNFSNPESLDQLFWVVYLLKKGYNPKHILVEKKWQGGRPNSGGRMDIVINNKLDNAWCVLDAKRRKYEYSKFTNALNNMTPHNQVASYFGYSASTIRYIGTATTKFDKKNQKVVPVANVISTKGWSYKNGSIITKNVSLPLKPSFDFSSNSPYNSKSLKPSDLRPISDSQGSKTLLQKFRDLIRASGISDITNAYNKILNLFIAKIFDEIQSRDTNRVKFVNSDVPDNVFMSTIISLYKKGMNQKVGIKSNNKSMINLKDTLESNNIDKSVAKAIMNDARNIQAHSDSIFKFKAVYDEKTYRDNVHIVRQAVYLLQRFRFLDPNKNTFLGYFFESILKNSFKQESGQFFTPIPIGRYIMKSLPLKHIVMKTLKHNHLPKMIDFACGSGHFLTTYMKAIQHIIDTLNVNKLTSINARNKISDCKIHHNRYRWASKCVYGIEVDYRLVKTSKVDTYLNGDGVAHIIHANALDALKDFRGELPLADYDLNDGGTNDKEFDLIISNPPYTVKHFLDNIDLNDFPALKDDFVPTSKEIELAFVERATQLLKDGGYIAIVLPSAFLNRTKNLQAKARQLFLNNFSIKSITALPTGTFYATGTSTVLIMAQKRSGKEFTDNVNSIKNLFKQEDYDKKTVGHVTNAIGKYEKYIGQPIAHKDTTEAEKIATWLENRQPVAIIKPRYPKKKGSQNFLGYTFSGRNGHEGIQPIAKGFKIEQLSMLYGKGDNDKRLDYINRQMFGGHQND